MQTDFTWNPTLVEESQILNGDEFYDFRNSDHTHKNDVFYVFRNIGIVPLRSTLNAFFAFMSHNWIFTLMGHAC
jgi:hypothetical protein